MLRGPDLCTGQQKLSSRRLVNNTNSVTFQKGFSDMKTLDELNTLALLSGCNEDQQPRPAKLPGIIRGSYFRHIDGHWDSLLSSYLLQHNITQFMFSRQEQLGPTTGIRCDDAAYEPDMGSANNNAKSTCLSFLLLRHLLDGFHKPLQVPHRVHCSAGT